MALVMRFRLVAGVLAALSLLGLVAPTARAAASVTKIVNPDAYTCDQPGFIGFEDLADETDLSAGAISGVQFTTTAGYSWLVGDFSTGAYNGKYPSGGYTSQGTHWAWLGESQGAGRIDFVKGPASTFSLLVSDNQSAVSLEAYDAQGNLLETAGPSSLNYDTGTMDELKVSRPNADIAYVIVHDTGNFFLVDSICTDAPGVQGHPSSAVKVADNANEPVVAVNPQNPLNIVVAFNHMTSSGVHCGYSSSFDGGHTWSDTQDLTPPNIRGLNTRAGGDPALAFTPKGALYMACINLADVVSSTNPAATFIYDAISIDGGRSFLQSQAVVTGSRTATGYGAQPDQEQLTASPTSEDVYLCYAVTVTTPATEQTGINLSRLDVTGKRVATGSVVAHSKQTNTVGCTATVTPHGRVWVGWWNVRGQRAAAAYSDNAGSASLITFSRAYDLGEKNGFDDNTFGTRDASRHVWVRASRTNDGAIAAVWEDDNPGIGSPVASTLMSSTFSGGSWSAAKSIFSGAFQPALDSGADGRLALGFYIDWNGDGSKLDYTTIDVPDLGSDLGTPTVLSVAPSSVQSNLRGFRFGDYTSVAQVAGNAYGVWTDNGAPQDGQSVWFGHS
jgi:hypothetical protein